MKNIHRDEATETKLTRFDVNLEPRLDGYSFSLYREHTGTLYRTGLIGQSTEASFFVRSINYQLPDATMSRITSVAQRLERGAEEIARGGDEIVIMAQVSGEVEIDTGGKLKTLKPGDLTVQNRTRECVSWASDFTIMSLTVTSAKTPQELLRKDCHGSILKAEAGSARLLFRLFETFLEFAEDLSLAEASSYMEAILSIAAASFARLRMPARVNPKMPDQRLRDKALMLINDNILDPALGPEMLCEKLGLSRATLYRLFEPMEGVRKVISRQRLDQAMNALLASTSADGLVARLASSNGFATPAQFTRAFRARYATSPLQMFALIRRNNRAAWLSQARLAGFANVRAWLGDLAVDSAVRSGRRDRAS